MNWPKSSHQFNSSNPKSDQNYTNQTNCVPNNSVEHCPRTKPRTERNIMRPILLLMAVGLCLLMALAQQDQNRFHLPFNSDEQDTNGQQQKMRTPSFQPGRTYKFQYNAQIASGLIAQDEQNQADAQQKAITRIQAQAKITFGSENHAQLCLRQIRTGQLNELVEDEQQVQPMSIFEPKQIPSKKKRLLERCCQFDYADGVIVRVQFDHEDEAWSRNMKKGVLQMIQLNLKRNNAQGLRNEMNDQQGEDQEEDNEQENVQQQQEKDTLAMSFTIPECSKIADVAFGNQIQEEQPQCTHCQQQFQEQMPQECPRGNCFYNAADQSESNATFHFVLNCDNRQCQLAHSNMIQSYTDGNFSHKIVGELKFENVWQQATDETSSSLGYDYDNSEQMLFPMFGSLHDYGTLLEDNCDNCEKKRVQLANLFDSAIDTLQKSMDILCEIDNNTSIVCKDASKQVINSIRFTRIILSKNVLCNILSGACRTSSPTPCDTCNFVFSTVSDILETIDEPLKNSLGILLNKEPLRKNALAAYDFGMISARAWLSKFAIPGHCSIWGC